MYRFILFFLLAFLPAKIFAVTVTATVTPTACTPCNGSITATASAGTAPYQYSIDGGITWQSSGLFSGLCAATYTVTARDAALATATVTATVVQNSPLSFTATGVNCTAFNVCDGQITVNISGGVPPYTIRRQWGPGPSTQFHSSSPITGLCPNTYTITVTDASNNCGNGYMAPVVITIGVGPPPGPGGLRCDVGYSVGQCQWVCDNTLYATGSGGTPPYMYSLNGGPFQSSGTFPNLCEGNNTYNVCVRDAAMNVWCCPAYFPTNMPYNRWPPTVTAANCTCNGVISFGSPIAGEMFYLYQNSILIAQNSTGIFTGLCGGTYLLNSYYNGCYNVFPNVVVPTNPSFTTTIVSTQPTCYGGNNGTITCTPNPWSSTGYQYSKDNGTTWQSSNVFTGLTAGTYSLRVKDSTNCYGNYTQAISNPAQLPLTLSISHPNCANGNCLGGIICNPTTGPTAPYQWSKDGGVTWQSSNQFMNLCSGTYTVTVRDTLGCTRNSSAFLSSTLFQYYIGYVRTNPTCTNPCGGVINLTLGSTNAPAGYNQFSIDSGVTWQSGTFFNNLCADTYYAQARNTLSGCYSPFVPIVVSPPVPLAITATSPQQSCPSTCNGTIQASFVSGSNPPYSYSIDGGNTWQSSTLFSNVCAGTYTVTMKNSLNCTATQTVTVNSTPTITPSATSASPICFGDCNGTITASPVTGPAGPYQYSIDGNNWYASNIFTGVCAGTFTLSVKDSFNCITTTPVTINSPPPLIANITSQDPSCYNSCNGGIIMNPSTPAGYEYSIDSGLTWQSTNSFSNLCADQYNIMLHDSGGCVFDSLVVLSNPAQIVTDAVESPEVCYNSCNGSVTLTPQQPGTYQFSIDYGVTWQSSGNYSSLCSGFYDCYIEDANGCADTILFVIASPPPVVLSVPAGSVNCYGDCNGQLNANISPSGNYQFTIDTTQTWQSGNQFANLCAGDYMIIAEDAAGCRDTIYSLVSQPDPIALTSTVANPPCYGGLGSLWISTDINNPQVSIDGGVNWSMDTSYINLPEGIYFIVVGDSMGCQAFDTVVIDIPPQLYLLTNVVDDTCNACEGWVMFSENVPPWEQFVITVSPGNATTNLCAGNYGAVLTNSSGCTASTSFSIQNISTLSIDSANSLPSVVSQATGSAFVYATGPGPLTYLWDANAGNQTTDTAINLAQGNYCVWVTDANGCTDSACVTVGVITTTGDESTVQYSVYPNPTHDAISIQGDNYASIQLFDVAGRMICDFGYVSLTPAGTQINLPGDLATGVYSLKISTGEQTSYVELLVD